ncbi:MAG: hypothetical protein EOP45_08975, partial [Sphingobacteriaceae bacterium]
MTFDQLYKTANKAEPPLRSIFHIKMLLEKGYEVAESPFFSTHTIFDAIDDSPIAIHRTTAKRMILEIEQLEGAPRFSSLASQSIEAAIVEIHYVNEFLKSESQIGSIGLEEPILAGRMRATIRYLIDCARTSVVLTKKLQIQEYLETITEAEDKIKWLKKMILIYEQTKISIDKKQYEALFEFLKLEKKKWKLDTHSSSIEKMSNHSIRVGAGGIVNVSHGNEAVQAVNTGAGAQQNVASGKSVNQTIGSVPVTSLNKLLEQLAHFIVTDPAFAASRHEMEQQLDSIKVQLSKQEPKKSIIKRALESLT